MTISDKQNEVLQTLETIGPMTSYELRKHFGISKDSCRDILRRLKSKDMVRIVGYEFDESGAGRKVQVFAKGGGGDVDKPKPNTELNLRQIAKSFAKKRQSYGVWAGLV